MSNIAGRKSKNLPMTAEQIAAREDAARPSSRVYKHNARESDKAEISRIVATGAGMLRNVVDESRRIELNDTAAVQAATGFYLQVCEQNAIMPSFTGLALSLGFSPQGLQMHMKRHPDSATTEWLTTANKVFSEMLQQAMLTGATAPIPSIFLLKCRGLNESGSEAIMEAVQDDTKMTADMILERYSDLPDD